MKFKIEILIMETQKKRVIVLKQKDIGNHNKLITSVKITILLNKCQNYPKKQRKTTT